MKSNYTAIKTISSGVIFAVAIAISPCSISMEAITQELKSALTQTDVAQELAEPDGSSFKLLPDGSWQIFGTGSGTYDFNDPEDIASATQEATLKAKANIVKYLKEKISSTEGINNVSQKQKTLVKNAGGDEKSVKKEDIKTQVTNIVSAAEDIVQGIVVLESTKTPDSGGGGTVQVKVGQSSKSKKVAIGAAAALHSSSDGGNVAPSGGQPMNPGENISEKRKSSSDF